MIIPLTILRRYLHMIFGKKIEVHNDGNSVLIEFDGYIANVTINGSDKMTVSYSDNLDLDDAAKKLTAAIIQEEEKSKKPFYNEIFPAFGREFKILVSNILKARV